MGTLTALKKFFSPEAASKKFQQEIEAQKVSLRILKTEYEALSNWHVEYVSTLSILTQSMQALVWKKDKYHQYILANPMHCATFFGLNVTKECLEGIAGKSDNDLIDDAYEKSGITNSFKDTCKLADDYVIGHKKPVHFFEAGIIDGEDVLFYTVRTPQYDKNGDFDGTVGIAWDMSDSAKFMLIQLARWIYSGKVIEILKKENIFIYAVSPELTKCSIFKHVCPIQNKDGRCVQDCKLCKDENGEDSKNDKMGDSLQTKCK